jgi:hypothetical protein
MDDAAVRARLDRYLDLVEAWALCPWAAPARRGGELRVEIVRDVAEVAGVIAGWATAGPAFRIGLVVLADVAIDPPALRRLRDRLARHASVAIADFHPDGGDVAKAMQDPAKLVPILRRSPDPMLQVVPQAALAQLAMPPPTASGAAQAAMLAGAAGAAAVGAREKIAALNLEMVRARGIEALVAELEALRRPDAGRGRGGRTPGAG